MVRSPVDEDLVGKEAGYLLMWQMTGKAQAFELLAGKVGE